MSFEVSQDFTGHSEFRNGELPSFWDDVQIEYVNRLVDTFKLTRFIETGTYHGNTSLYFWRRGLKVYTTEIWKPLYEENAPKFLNTAIQAHNLDSRRFLTDLWIDRGNELSENTLFFFDAHWHEAHRYDCALYDELDILMKLPRFLAVIHDVEVPGQNQFTVDWAQTDAKWHQYWTDHVFKDTVIYPNYNIPMRYYPFALNSYCILSRGYALLLDPRFRFLSKIYPEDYLIQKAIQAKMWADAHIVKDDRGVSSSFEIGGK